MYLFWASFGGSKWKSRLTMISWARVRLERSLPDDIMSSRVMFLGGLAVVTPRMGSRDDVKQNVNTPWLS